MHSAGSLQAVHGLSAVDARPRSKGVFARIFARLSRAIGALRREFAYRRAIAELARMDGLLLKDIGIARAEIYSAVRTGRRLEDEGTARLRPNPPRGAGAQRCIAAHRNGVNSEPTAKAIGRPGFERLVALRTGAPC